MNKQAFIEYKIANIISVCLQKCFKMLIKIHCAYHDVNLSKVSENYKFLLLCDECGI